MIAFAKAHAYGNDFLYVRRSEVAGAALDTLARAMCDRHTGIGADGLIVYEQRPGGAAMQLFNADGGRAEVSGNGVRALAALLARSDDRARLEMVIETEGGTKRLTRLAREGGRQTFRAAMGSPADLRREALDVAGERLDLVVLNIGNPQAILLGPLPDDMRFARLGPALEHHAAFPRGTNVEFVTVETPARLRIRIWERGVGATASSGTGACASLVAAAAFGGAARDAEVIAPGGAQRVEWLADGVYLTGWADLVCEGTWLRTLPDGIE
jgi:diaminopimelate epimerase